jgi:hypothetical protein
MWCLTCFGLLLFFVLPPQFLAAGSGSTVVELNSAPLPLALPVIIIPRHK